MAKLITIASFINIIDAQLLRARLESSGIKCFIADENTVAINWLYSNFIGGVKVQVLEKDLEKAKEIFEEKPVVSETLESQVKNASMDACPECGSSSVYYEKYARKKAFIAFLFLGLPVPFLKRKWKCYTCGHEWC